MQEISQRMSYKSIQLNKSVTVAAAVSVAPTPFASNGHTHTHRHTHGGNIAVYIVGAQTWLTFTANEFLSAVKWATAPELTN